MVPFAGSATANCTGILMGVTSPRGDAHTCMASAVRSPLGFRWALGGWRPVLALAGLARVAAGRDLCARAGCAFTPARTDAGSPRRCVQARDSRHSRKKHRGCHPHRNGPIGRRCARRRGCVQARVLHARCACWAPCARLIMSTILGIHSTDDLFGNLDLRTSTTLYFATVVSPA